MNQQTQTLKFLVAAIVSVVLAMGTWMATRPTPIEGFGKVGEPFFTSLKVDEATALRVAGYKEDVGETDYFIVQKDGDRWELPEYNNYPADGDDQLGKTAASLVAIERGAVASRQVADHKRLGVIDPEGESKEVDGRGQKITLYKGGTIDGGGTAMAALIIGNEVPDRTDEHYVRIPDEDETYIAKLDIELSTKFSDWVEDDLLKVDRDKVVRLETKSTNVEERQIVESVESLLARENSSDDWKLDGLDDETEELNGDDVSELVRTLDSVKIAGVRARTTTPEGDKLLDGNLKPIIPKGYDPRSVQSVLQNDLSKKGFQIYLSESNEFRLFATEGELIAGTNDGIAYHLSFGQEFEGTDEEILVGGAASESEDGDDTSEEDKPAGPDAEEDADAAESADVEDDSNPELKKSRYLFVRASFDETLLGPALVEPVEPTVPEGVQVDEDGNVTASETPAADADEAPAEKTDADDTATEEAAEPSEEAAEGESEATDENATPEGETETEPETEPVEEVKPDPVAAYKTAVSKFESDKADYEREVESRAKKTEEGREKVEELNARFSDWYYVISADDFDKLRLTRDKLVKAKEKEEPAEGTEGADSPIPPSLNPVVPPETPAPTTPDSDTPDPDTPAKPDAPDTPSEPTEAKPAEAKPAAKTPAPTTPPADKADDKPAEKPAASDAPADADKPDDSESSE